MAYLNIASNKPATASGYVKPFEAARAVNGTTAPTSRWLCNSVSSTNPAKLTVSLGGLFIITSWVVKHMGVTGWASPNYNMSDYKLQGSQDNNTWYDLDSVVSNTVAITNRTITSTNPYRYVRLSVTKGLNTNPQLASAVEFEVYGYTTPLLSSLVVSAGSTPLAFDNPFLPTRYTYTVPTAVPYATSSVNLSAVPQDSTATVKVNGTAIAYGANVPVALNVGSNTITVDVFGKDGQMKQTYTVAITRQQGAILTGLTISSGTLTPGFTSGNTTYSDSVAANVASVTVTPTSAANATITVNGQAVVSGNTSQAISLPQNATTPISVVVTSADGTSSNTYTINVSRPPCSSDATLSALRMSASAIIGFSPTKFTYTVNNVKTSSTTVTATAANANASITVNGQAVTSGQPSQSISLIVGANNINVVVTAQDSVTVNTYVITLNRTQ